MYFPRFGIFFSSGRGSFFVLSALWHTGSPPVPHTVLKFGSWPMSVARALGVESGASDRGGIRSSYSHPGAYKLTYRLY